MAMAETVENADKLINKIKRRPFTKIIKTYSSLKNPLNSAAFPNISEKCFWTPDLKETIKLSA